ncbi:MAG TPA: hypothetical protein VER96_28660 [Polyangiaceae bacterium]|nr:hypothetical protein [Polyangiaceae bacterium]
MVLGCIAGVELIYLIGANLFLNLGWLPLAFSGTNDVNATISGGWSVIPGRVHVRDLRFIFHDHNVQFSLDMRRASLVVHLSELPRKVFHASHLRGEGAVYRMRQRIDPWKTHDPDVGTYPPIPEYATPAVFEARVPEPELSDAEYNLWTVHIDDVDARVSEVWVQAFRYRGAGRVRGQFQLKPARNLWVGPALLELEPGLLTAGAYHVAEGIHGQIDCIVHPFDVRVAKGFGPLRYISARVRLDSPTFDPQAFALFASEGGPRVSSLSGSLHLDVQTRHGLFTRESRVDIVQRNFEARAAQGELDAEQLEVHAGLDEHGHSQATLLIERGTLRESIAPGRPPRIEHLSASVVSENSDTSQPFQFFEARLNEAQLGVGDANWLNRWLKDAHFTLTGGALSVLARARYADSMLDADAMLETDGLSARLDKKQVHYAGALAVQLERADPEHATGKLNADLSGRALRVTLGGHADELRLAGFQAHVRAHRDEHGNALDGQAKLWNFSAANGDFRMQAPGVIALARSEQRGNGSQLTHFKAEIPVLHAEGRGARLTTAALARGTFAQQKNTAEQSLELWASLLKPHALVGSQPVKRATTPHVELHAALHTDARGALSGKLGLAPAAWVVEAGNMRFSGNSALDAELAALDLARHSGELSAHLSSTGVTVGDTTQNANCPWSRVDSLQMDGVAKLLARGSTSLSVNGKLRQTELNWGDFMTRGDLAVNAHFEQGVLESEVDGRVDLRLEHGSFQSGGGGSKGWAAQIPALEVSANFTRRAGKLAGTAHVDTASAHGRIGATRVNADLAADFVLDHLDLNASTMHGSGAVHVRNASLPNAPEPITNWWADVKLDSLFAHAQTNLELGGMFRANLRDAAPGLAVLSSQGELPKWVATAFPLRELSVTGSLARRCRLTDIRLVQMAGGPAVARGRLQSVPDGFQGALLVRLAAFEAMSAGIDFDAQHTHVGLFHGDDWLSRFNHSFDLQAENAVNLACPPDPNTCTEPAVSVAASDPQ